MNKRKISILFTIAIILAIGLNAVSSVEENVIDFENETGNNWITVTIQFPEMITEYNAENLYYGGYYFMFQVKEDTNSTLFVVPDYLQDKFNSVYLNNSDVVNGTKINIKYHEGTAVADLTGEIYPIYIIDDIE